MHAFKATPLVLFFVLVASACASSHHAGNAPLKTGTAHLTPGEAAVARVKSSFWGKGFESFPIGQTRIGCRIPGPVGEGIKGTCQTRVVTNSSRGRALVTFTEFWPARKFRTHGPPRGTLQHSWRFEVTTARRRAGRVLRLGGEGAFPPQASD